MTGDTLYLGSAALFAGAVLGPTTMLYRTAKTSVLASHMGPVSWTTRFLIADAIFCIGIYAFLKAAEAYGRQREPRAASYPGPWRKLDGSQALPAFFHPYYLGVAFASSVVLPMASLFTAIYSRATVRGGHKEVAAATAILSSAASVLLPYAAVHLFQMYLELKELRYSIMAPAVPISVMFYRLAQLGRSYWLLNSVYHGSAPAWLFGVLSFLTFFWVYDTGVVLSFLPWTYNWQLTSPIAAAAPAAAPDEPSSTTGAGAEDVAMKKEGGAVKTD